MCHWFKNEDKELIKRSYSFLTLQHIFSICNFHLSLYFAVQSRAQIHYIHIMQKHWVY